MYNSLNSEYVLDNINLLSPAMTDIIYITSEY